MRKKTLYVLAVLTVLIFGHEAFAQSEIQVENIQSQIVGSPDTAGYVQFSVTASVWNPTRYGTEFSADVEGINSNGSPLTRVTLWGRVGGEGEGTLVGQGAMSLATYDSIANWVPIS